MAPKTPRCKLCRHPERYRIELMRASGVPYETLGAKFGLTKDMIWRHWRLHVSAETKSELICGPVQLAELAQRASAENLSLLDYLALIRSRLLALFTAGAEAGDKYGTSVVVGRLLQTLKFQARLSGELLEHAGHGVNVTTNVLVVNSPEFARLQTTVISALSGYPDARRAVVEALRGIETDQDAPGQPLLLEAQAHEEASYAAA